LCNIIWGGGGGICSIVRDWGGISLSGGEKGDSPWDYGEDSCERDMGVRRNGLLQKIRIAEDGVKRSSWSSIDEGVKYGVGKRRRQTMDENLQRGGEGRLFDKIFEMPNINTLNERLLLRQMSLSALFRPPSQSKSNRGNLSAVNTGAPFWSVKKKHGFLRFLGQKQHSKGLSVSRRPTSQVCTSRVQAPS